MKKTLCTVCMRAGSRGIKNKNITKINNKPLFFYTLEQAIKSKIFNRIVISTDSKKIANLATKKGYEVFFLRPAYLSRDNSPKVPVVRHALLKAEKYYKERYDHIVDLDVTSPLRNIIDIKESYKTFVKSNSSVLVTVSPANKNPYFNQVEYKNNRYTLVKKMKNNLSRRQDAPKVYDMNASVHIWNRNFLLKSNNLFPKKTSIYIMPPERSCDIDNHINLEFVKFFLNRKSI